MPRARSRRALRLSSKLGYLAAAALAVLGAPAFGVGMGSGVATPPMVVLQPRPFPYRLAGEFTRDGRPASPPARTHPLDRPLVIMARQVTAAEYDQCVAEHACPAIPEDGDAIDRPAVKVSWHDATAYAAWLSRRSGATYRLPTDEEWAFAAGSRYRDDGLPEDGADPARRWLAQYARDAERDEALDAKLRPIGGFGVNENGMLDLAGNVWEWTNTCFTRQALAPSGPGAPLVNCGVRVAEGRHRAYLVDFIRDPRAGGCSVGKPPSFVGFRLVREDGPWAWLRSLKARLGV
ncbi:MAG TPA: SUMF1/EgtB/PvdO family nonheme iron enzyme [Stellaceae bacterium]|nr:SUMF1/EgtB/PvdO family nonheme iron enzyme [Stellaceae bacterium]